MAFRYSVPVFLALLIAAGTPAARAQFTQPTPDELKMTADSKAPGISAIYLYQEEVTDDQLHFLSIYERIKVLTEKGKELATIHVPYVRGRDTVTDIQGRTIHADGSIVPLTAKPSDLMDYKVKDFQVDSVVFTLPSAEVGSILEYRLKIRSGDSHVSEPTWNIQGEYPVVKAHYSFHPYTPYGVQSSGGKTLTRLMWSTRLAPGVELAHEDRKDIYSLDLADIPAAPNEDWMPPLNTLKWRVEFYYTNSTSGAAFWEDAGKRWAKDVQEFTSPTSGLKKAADGMVAASDTDLQKAQKIYEAVMKIENTDFTRKKSEAERKKERIKEIHKAEDVWKEQSGTGDEIALLYVALARVAGLKAWPVQVVNRDRAIFDGRYLSTRQLDDFLALVNLDGKDTYLDPGQKMCPFGRLHWKHMFAGGLKLTDQGTVPVSTPGISFKTAVVDRVADLTIDPQGALKGSVRFVMTGPDALHWRQMTLENDQEEVKKQFNESIRDSIPDGVQADFDHFLALDDYSSNLVGIVKVIGNIGTATGKHFFLPASFFESRSKHPFVAQDKRTTPIDVHYAKMEQDDVTYHLPAGYTVETAVPLTQNNWPGHAAMSISSKCEGSDIIVQRVLAYNFVLLDAKDYSNLHDFYQKVATADQQQLVLSRVPAAKGN